MFALAATVMEEALLRDNENTIEPVASPVITQAGVWRKPEEKVTVQEVTVPVPAVMTPA